MDSDPKVRRRMGPCDDQRSACPCPGHLLSTGISDPDALPAKHPDGREPASDKEQPPRRGTDVLRRNAEAAYLWVCLLRGRHPRRRRILVLRRVPQVWRGRSGSPEDENLPVRKQGERRRSAREPLDPRNRPKRDTVLKLPPPEMSTAKKRQGKTYFFWPHCKIVKLKWFAVCKR